MFVATGLIGGPHPRLPQERIASSEELIELAAAGFEVGAHTVDHPRLTTMSYRETLDQLTRSRTYLEDLLGSTVRSMAYPYGAFDEHTLRAVSHAGYEIACACSGPAPWRALTLPREPVFPSTSKLQLQLKLAGRFGPVQAKRGLRARLRSQA